MGMEEKNEYFINIDNLEIILNRNNIHLSDEEKSIVIEIINSDSVNNKITNSDLDYSKQIIVLRIYLEWKNYVIEEKFKMNNYSNNPNKLSRISQKIKEIRNRGLENNNKIKNIKTKYLYENE